MAIGSGSAQLAVDLVASFVRAAQAGMFSTNPAADTQAVQLSLVSGSGEQELRFVGKTEGIHIGAYRVLLNMVELFHRFVAPVASFRVFSLHAHGDRLGLREIASAPFPPKPSPLPFQFRAERSLDDSRDPAIRLQLARRTDDQELGIVTPSFVAWDEVVLRGGYYETAEDRDPGLDLEESLAGQQTYLSAPDVVEHVLYEFVGRREAYDALTNMAVRLHKRVFPIASLEVS
jgi:hypothetical protein